MKEQYPIIQIPVDYRPSSDALAFHHAPQRFRILCWGVKSGKTRAGAWEFARAVAAQPRRLSWVVSPSFNLLQAAEWDLAAALFSIPGLVPKHGYNRHSHDIILSHGGVIQCRSADIPDNMRGPNVDGILWLDEAPYLKDVAWHICRQKISATGAEIIMTGTPNGRNWFYAECQKSGMPADGSYGAWASEKYFVSHWPTSHFPWVKKEELNDIKTSTPSMKFQQDYEAIFVSGAMEAFSHIEEAFTLVMPQSDIMQSHYVIGYDPGQKQDPAGLVVLRAMDGRVMDVQRWISMPWELQIAKIREISKKWGYATVGFDRANVGSVLDGMMQSVGISSKPVDLNSPQVKNDLILGLQVAFEQHRIKLPDFRVGWTPAAMKNLYDELKWYEPKITTGGKISYSAPKGLTDDLVIALAIAHHMRMIGAGSNSAVSIIYGGDGSEIEDDDISNPEEYEYRPIFKPTMSNNELRPIANIDKSMAKVLYSKHPNVGKKIFGNRSVPGLRGSGLFWR